MEILFSIYFIILWGVGVLYCFDFANTTPYLGEREKIITKIAMWLLCILLPKVSMLVGIVGLAKYTTDLQEKWRKS